mgnify:CR=1 FL=1
MMPILTRYIEAVSVAGKSCQTGVGTVMAGVYRLVAGIWYAMLTVHFRLIVRLFYRFRVHHRGQVPSEGPALIVCNHVSYLDWLFLWVGSPRPLRFVIWPGFDRNPWLKLGWALMPRRLLRIGQAAGCPHDTSDALERVSAALDAGDVVVIFPEGTLTRNGQMLPFGRELERILRSTSRPVPVVPAYLDNLWGSVWSWSGGQILWKWPSAFRRRVVLQFGTPLPATSATADVRLAVQECAADAGIAASHELLPMHRGFVRMASSWRNLLRPAFVDLATGTEKRLTWGKTLVAVWCLSRWLRPRLQEEPIVGIWLPTGLGSALANLALSFLQKTSVNLNYTAGPGPVASAIRQTGMRFVITAKRFESRVSLELPDGVERIYLEDALAAISSREKLLRFVGVLVLPGWLLERWLGLTRTQLDDCLTIIFSSGSTGEPKGVMLSHRNIASNIDGFIRGVELQRSDRILATLPYFHSFGYTVCLWAPAIVGMEAVFFPDPRQAKEVGELCQKYQCSIMLGTATFLRFYLRRSGRDDFRSLRLLICGAEKLPIKLAQEFFDRFGVWPLEGYGCTELSPVVCTNLHDVTIGGMKQTANILGTVGQPLPGQIARTFDPETLAVLPAGTEGVLGVKGANVMLGYFQQPEKTAQVIHQGYYITGDMGIIESTGFIRITGRLNRFAKIAGEMIPLERLDEELHDILGQHEERALVVASVPCDRRGERLIVLHRESVAGQLAVAFETLRHRGLPNLWVPDLRDCFLIEEFPTLGSGKLDLRRVGELAMEIATKAPTH